MRISTSQIFKQNLNSMMAKQNSTAELVTQLSVGKKVITTGDDPVAAVGIDNLNQQNVLIEQYLRNIDFANHRLSLTESKLGMVDNIAASFRDKFLSANNGGITNIGRSQIAAEMRDDLNVLLDIANSQDESGNYIFSGFKTDTLPFVFDANDNIRFQGDTGVRYATVAFSAEVGVNISGESAFLQGQNAIGDFAIDYNNNNQTGIFEVEKASITNTAAYINDDYNFNFYNHLGNVGLVVTNSANNVVAAVNQFDSSIPVSFNGIEVTIDGQPQVGDSFRISPEQNVNFFDAMQQAIAMLENNTLDTPAGKAEFSQVLQNLDASSDQVGTSRVRIGSQLNNIDGYINRHNEEKVVNAGALSILEDLDYAEAITELEKEKIALNAISTVIGKIGTLSLFDYL